MYMEESWGGGFGRGAGGVGGGGAGGDSELRQCRPVAQLVRAHLKHA